MKGGGNHHYHLSRCLVACNVYISAGNQHYRDILVKILEDTQNYCLKKQQQQQKQRVLVVHAYADGPYNRSSIHLAGTPRLVSNVVSHLATNAIKTLSSSLVRQNEEEEASSSIAATTSASTSTSSSKYTTTKTDHPTVGLVDHVSILPLTSEEFDNKQIITKEQWYDYYHNHPSSLSSPSFSTTTTTAANNTTTSTTSTSTTTRPDTPTVPTGWVAREVGIALQSIGVDVLLYGYAHQNNIPLATIRRERTNFFNKSSLAPVIQQQHQQPASSSSSTTTYPVFGGGGQATVGSPTYFVENYNIRFKRDRPKKLTLSLTKYLREKDGGLKYVEALTLPYSQNRYETACNLLNPDVTSTKDVDVKIQEWINNTIRKDGRCNDGADDNDNNNPIEISYRVGTTASQCIDALQQTSTPTSLEGYNSRILERFRRYL